jgi:hypothetical protein
MWAMVNTDSARELLTIYCLPTGDEGPPPEWEHIDSVQLHDGTVWHFFK